jgi:hypothetical protein
MVRHILILRPRADATPAAIEASRVAITGLLDRIPGLLNVHWGVNFAPAERHDGFTHGFSMDFADRKSLDAYGPHPDHLPAAKLVRAAFDRIVVFDFDM